MSPAHFLEVCLYLGMTLIACAVIVGLLRLWLGPNLADRVLALDMMTSAIVAFCGIFAIATRSESYLDIAVALALVSFVSVVSLARYAERLARRSDHSD